MTTTESRSAAAPSARAVGPADGPAAAALLAAGTGALVLGLLTTLAEASVDLRDALAFDSGVGPLSGKTIIAVLAWLVAWPVLHFTVGRRVGLTRTVLLAFAVLLALGVLGTFPTFFEVFASD